MHTQYTYQKPSLVEYEICMHNKCVFMKCEQYNYRCMLNVIKTVINHLDNYPSLLIDVLNYLTSLMSSYVKEAFISTNSFTIAVVPIELVPDKSLVYLVTEVKSGKAIKNSITDYLGKIDDVNVIKEIINVVMGR